MSKIAAIAKLTTVEGKRDEVVAAFAPLFEHVRGNEAGTLVYALHEDAGDPNLLWFYELYEGDEALDAHSTSDAMKGLKLKGLLAGRPDVIRLNPVTAKGIEF